jgi:hypothetical protein
VPQVPWPVLLVCKAPRHVGVAASDASLGAIHEIILNEDVTGVGVGIATGDYIGSPAVYVHEVLAAPI